MPRFRRYRVFVACALFVVFLLYRVSSDPAWEDDFESQFQYVAAVLPNAGHRPAQADLAQRPSVPYPPAGGDGPSPRPDDRVKIPDLKPDLGAGDSFALPPPTAADGHAPAAGNRPAGAGVPDRRPGKVQDVYPEGAQDDLDLHMKDPPGRFEPSATFTPPTHWTRPAERFPVEEGSLIPLPTGKARAIPTIQHSFGPETEEARAKREDRLDQVRAEAKRAWDAYTQYAFGHDELLVSDKKFRDPFCGWGATLVDSLDTLWIMGLKDEFDGAYNGLNNVDFTTTNRNDIPVFETTIRYLGGLLGAYDLTGGHKGDYPLLLNKAVELAEVLMGVFDTPNRMPVLYYQWKPAHASQPKRAHTRAGVAELGTLSMEFTRLAQLTGKDKYYDAVARITNALEEWQNREDTTASRIPGIFPENIDASGCNKSATRNSIDNASLQAQQQAKHDPQHEPEGYKPKKAASSEAELRDNTNHGGAGASRGTVQRRDTSQNPPKIGPSEAHWSASNKGGSSSRGPVNEPLAADGLPTNWECVAQNLTAASGTQSFGMGGSQDSAYEYFPKQYLLLGGLEAKYRSMHEKTVAAVKEHLLYRPMTRDNADILFSSKLQVAPADDLEVAKANSRNYEVTHLTCFLGGMFAMGGKIFDSEEDLEIGRRLTDGCVWAYSSMPTGIMAETAYVTPCPDSGPCQWNDSAWYLGIDPNPQIREAQMNLYMDKLAEWEVVKNEALRAEAVLQQAAEELGIPVAPSSDTKPNPKSGVPNRDRGGSSRLDDDAQYQAGHSKRDVDPVSGDTLAFDPSLLDQQAIEEKIRKLDEEFFAEPEPAQVVPPSAGSPGGPAGQVPIEQNKAMPRPQPKPRPPFKVPAKPRRPQTHLEFVADRINSGALPPGYTQIGSNGYQLRPEAIESVWYMYRITGDPIWQEKGWTMWQSILSHVRDDPAHSAINGVNDLTKLRHMGTMESFWIAETLKYFYLLYSEPDVISLDDWVLNTEAHPFRRPS